MGRSGATKDQGSGCRALLRVRSTVSAAPIIPARMRALLIHMTRWFALWVNPPELARTATSLAGARQCDACQMGLVAAIALQRGARRPKAVTCRALWLHQRWLTGGIVTGKIMSANERMGPLGRAFVGRISDRVHRFVFGVAADDVDCHDCICRAHPGRGAPW